MWWVVSSHAIMAPAASPSMEKNQRMRISSSSIEVLESSPWQMLDPTQMFPTYSSALPRLIGWIETCGFGKVIDDTNIKAIEWFNPCMARSARNLQFMTMDKLINIAYILTTKSFFCSSREDPFTHMYLKSSMNHVLSLQLFGFHIFQFLIQVQLDYQVIYDYERKSK